MACPLANLTRVLLLRSCDTSRVAIHDAPCPANSSIKIPSDAGASSVRSLAASPRDCTRPGGFREAPGLQGQPVGLFRYAGLPTVSIAADGGNVAYSHLLSLEELLGIGFADFPETAAFLTTPGNSEGSARSFIEWHRYGGDWSDEGRGRSAMTLELFRMQSLQISRRDPERIFPQSSTGISSS